MVYRNYLRGLSVAALLFGLILIFLTLFLSPESGFSVIGIYVVSFFFFILGVSALFGFLFRRWWFHNEVLFANVRISVRQAILVASFLSSLLILSAMHLLNLWDGAILAISFILVEMYFKSRGFDEV